MKLLAQFPDVVEDAARELEPHRIVFHLIELAGAFHRFYNRHRVIGVDPALGARSSLPGRRRAARAADRPRTARRQRAGSDVMRKRMAERRSPGLTFGQLITLTFGFLLASVVIFVFGMWVGRDLAEQQAAKQRDVARVPVAPPGPEPTPAPGRRRGDARAGRAVRNALATRRRRGHDQHAGAGGDGDRVIAVRIAATATRARRLVATPPAATTPPAGGCSVQAYATNDMMKAVMLSRTLKSKGYAASTASKQMRRRHLVPRAGRPLSRPRRRQGDGDANCGTEEGLEAASVIAQ